MNKIKIQKSISATMFLIVGFLLLIFSIVEIKNIKDDQKGYQLVEVFSKETKTEYNEEGKPIYKNIYIYKVNDIEYTYIDDNTNFLQIDFNFTKKIMYNPNSPAEGYLATDPTIYYILIPLSIIILLVGSYSIYDALKQSVPLILDLQVISIERYKNIYKICFLNKTNNSNTNKYYIYTSTNYNNQFKSGSIYQANIYKQGKVYNYENYLTSMAAILEGYEDSDFKLKSETDG